MFVTALSGIYSQRPIFGFRLIQHVLYVRHCIDVFQLTVIKDCHTSLLHRVICFIFIPNTLLTDHSVLISIHLETTTKIRSFLVNILTVFSVDHIFTKKDKLNVVSSSLMVLSSSYR